MRRALLAFALVALTGTLLAQTPRTTVPLTRPDQYHATISFTSQQQDRDKLIMKGVRVEFELGVTITADEASADKAKDGVMNLSGNVQMTLRK